MKMLIRCSPLVLLCGLGVWTRAAAPFEWPDSSHFWRALVNVTQDIQTRPKEWFAQDKLVTDFTIRNARQAGRERSAQEYQRVRGILESRGIVVGTYISGTTVLPETEQDRYPDECVPIELMPPNARYAGTFPRQPNRKFIDVTDVTTRRAFQAGIKQMWQSVPAPLRFVDNAGVHPGVAHMQPWAAYCQNLTEIRQIAESGNSRVIFNLVVHIGTMSDEETRLLMQAVGQNGIALEMPWHKVIRQNPDASAKAAARYRQLLDSGMAIVMIPVDTPLDELKAWVVSWRKPSDHLYLSGPFWQEPNPALFSAP